MPGPPYTDLSLLGLPGPTYTFSPKAAAPPEVDTVTTILQEGLGRGVKDSSIDSVSPVSVTGADVTLEIGTSGGKLVDSLFCFDLTNIPYDTNVVTTTFDLNILVAPTAGSDAEMEMEIMRLPRGLDLNFDKLNFNKYDGINVWPLKKYDRSLRLISAMPSSTGPYTFDADFSPLVREALREGEGQLIIVIARTQRTATHKLMNFDSSESVTQAFRPKLTINHTIPVPPQTVIRGGRLHVVRKWSID